jgi:putative ABC transport system permease protein
MRYLGLVLKGVRRNTRRTLLTVLSVAIAVFLFSSLRAILDGFAGAVAASSSTRIVTVRSTSLMFTMPVSHYEGIRAIRGVRDVTWANWFGGVYQDPANFFAQFAVDPESYLRVYPEILLTPEERQAFLADRTGAVVGSRLASRFGFKVGDRITLKVGIPIYGREDFTFTVRGIYRPGVQGFDDQTLLFHWRYADERSLVKGQVGWYVAELTDPSRAPAISADVDRRFANTAFETKTETEKAFQASFVSMMGNLNLLLGGIGAAVIITTLFVAGNTMAMSVRERTTEVAVMRTLGFPSHVIFMLVTGEAVVMALVGGIVGAGLARLVTSSDTFNSLSGIVPPFFVSAENVALGLALGAGIGLLAGLIPASMAARLKVVDALRRVA